MKLLFKAFTLCLPLVAFSLEIEVINTMTENILHPKSLISSPNHHILYNPFIYQSKGDTNTSNATQDIKPLEPSQQKLILYAIFQNRAKIGQSWYKLGEKVDEYTLLRIFDKSVILHNQTDTLRLFLKKESGASFTSH